ncbi:MAG: aminotransferase class I/II-fold pyridoxal phosphate-dependent enzyme, partial [Fidelibacterota bacterium]
MSLVPPHIKNLSTYKSGKPIDEVKREYGLTRVIKLASNENPMGLSNAVSHAVKNSMAESYRYPDTSGYELRSLLADMFRLKIENVVLGAGSEGIMSTIMRTFLSDSDEIIAAKNSFIGFKVLANASGFPTNWIPMKDYRYDLHSMADAVNENTKI